MAKKLQLSNEFITLLNNTKSVVSASTSTEYSTTTTNGEKIAMTGAKIIGSKLTLTNDGGIKIGTGVSYVKASGAILFSTITAADQRHHILIYKNSSNMSSLVFRLRGNWDSINIQPVMIQVSPNDVIYLYVRTQDGTGAKIYNAVLTVEVVK